MMTAVRTLQRGLTLIELMVVIAITAILLSLATPSFTDFMNRKRVEGVFTELSTDMQFARSEAVARNAPVRITFGAGCYVVHTVGTTATSCTQAGAVTLGTGAQQIKAVTLAANTRATLSPNASMTWMQFDNVRAWPTWDGTGVASGSVNVNSSAGSWQLRAVVSTVGRLHSCSPNASMSGYSSTC